MSAGTVDAVSGIDTHRDSHEAEIADVAGKRVTVMRIGNDSAGLAQLLAAIAEVALGPRVAVCTEGSRSYGIGLARALAAAGLLVIECEQPSRKQRRPVAGSDDDPAPGLGGSPSTGHLATATVNASWTASSAMSMSPKNRISVATHRPHSRRKTASTSALMPWRVPWAVRGRRTGSRPAPGRRRWPAGSRRAPRPGRRPR